MERSFRQTFPNAQVVVDPLLQMQRQVSDLRLRAGQSGPDDFLPLLARFAGALGPRANDALAALEYRDGKLRARFRADFLEGPAARESLRAALRQRGLQLEFEGEGDALAVVSLQT
jgi:general secretion pathway protein L